MSRFIALVHGWHVESNVFDIRELKAQRIHDAEREACWLKHLRDATFDTSAYVVVEIDDREQLPRRLTWRERLTGKTQ